eukprot:Skav210135  [mRNA]  locus=scaffold1493:28383:30273:+ [translate_table: standard]
MARVTRGTRMLLAMLLGIASRPFLAWMAGGSSALPLGQGPGRSVRIIRQQSPRQSESPTMVPGMQIEDAQAELETIFQDLRNLQHVWPEELEDLGALRQNLKSGKLRVLLIGDFSSGKSTLLNVLAGEAIAETGVLPTTADFHEVVCSGKNIVLVDTPGINAAEGEKYLVSPGHKEDVLDEVKRADYVMFVMKATSPGTSTEEQLQKLLQSYSTPGILVLSHWDQLDSGDKDEVKTHAKKFAAKAFPGKKTQLFGIDGKKAEKAIKAGGQHDEPGCRKLQSFLKEKLADKRLQLAYQLTRVCSRAKLIVKECPGRIFKEEQREKEAHQKDMEVNGQDKASLRKEMESWSQEKTRAEKDLKETESADEIDQKYYAEKDSEKDKEARQHGGPLGGAFRRGSEAAAAGAFAGSAFPVVGTAVGAVAGGVLGGIAGAFEGQGGKEEAKTAHEAERKNKADFEKRAKERNEKCNKRCSDAQAQRDRCMKKLDNIDEDQHRAKKALDKKLQDLSLQLERSKALLQRLEHWEEKWHGLLSDI